MQCCRDLPEMLSYLVNRSSTKLGPEVGIKIALCGLKGKMSLWHQGFTSQVWGGQLGVGPRYEYSCPSI